MNVMGKFNFVSNVSSVTHALNKVGVEIITFLNNK